MSDEDWEVVERYGDPAEAYTLYRHATTSGFSAYRIVSEFDAPAETVAMAALHAIRDVENSGFDSTLVSAGPQEIVVYQRIDLPLVSDRDVTTRCTFWYEPASNVYFVRWRNISDRGPAPIEGVVRLPRVEGTLQVQLLGPGRSRFTQESYVELGGLLPAWLVNSKMGGSMVGDLKRVRGLIGSGSYDRTEFLQRPASLPAPMGGEQPG